MTVNPDPRSASYGTPQLTCDTFLNGALTVFQHQTGYRFSIDAILLAGYVRPKAGERLIDLGCGCGIIALILAHRYPDLQIAGIEIQPALAGLARKNVAENQMADRVEILEGDIAVLAQSESGGTANIIVCNPPFGRLHTGRINPNSERALARHEIAMTLNDIMATARRLLCTGGRLTIVFPAERITDLLHEMRARGIEPKRIRPVQSCAADSARRILVEGLAGGRPGASVDSPLVIYGADGGYTDEVQQLMAS